MLLGDNRECHLKEQQLRASDGRASRSASHYSKVWAHHGCWCHRRALTIRLANKSHIQPSPIQLVWGWNSKASIGTRNIDNTPWSRDSSGTRKVEVKTEKLEQKWYLCKSSDIFYDKFYLDCEAIRDKLEEEEAEGKRMAIFSPFSQFPPKNRSVSVSVVTQFFIWKVYYGPWDILYLYFVFNLLLRFIPYITFVKKPQTVDSNVTGIKN